MTEVCNEATFIRDDINNTRNFHYWPEQNLRTTVGIDSFIFDHYHIRQSKVI